MESLCIGHEDIPIFYCDSCKVNVCLRCVTSLHKGHSLSDLIDDNTEIKDIYADDSCENAEAKETFSVSNNMFSSKSSKSTKCRWCTYQSLNIVKEDESSVRSIPSYAESKSNEFEPGSESSWRNNDDSFQSEEENIDTILTEFKKDILRVECDMKGALYNYRLKSSRFLTKVEQALRKQQSGTKQFGQCIEEINQPIPKETPNSLMKIPTNNIQNERNLQFTGVSSTSVEKSDVYGIPKLNFIEAEPRPDYHQDVHPSSTIEKMGTKDVNVSTYPNSISFTRHTARLTDSTSPMYVQNHKFKSSSASTARQAKRPKKQLACILPTVQVRRCMLTFSVNSVQCMTDGTVCMFCKEAGILYMMKTDFTIYKVKFDEEVQQIALHPKTDQAFCIVWKAKKRKSSIKALNTANGYLSKLFNIDVTAHPTCLTIRLDGTVLVGNCKPNSIINYNLKGETLHTVAFSTEPLHIAICKSSGHIAVSCGQNGVHVMDHAFHIKYISSGPTNSKSNDKVFTIGALFDDSEHLIVAVNNRLLIVDGENGTHLGTVSLDDIGRVKCLAINHKRELVVGTIETPSRLLFIEYVGT